MPDKKDKTKKDVKETSEKKKRSTLSLGDISGRTVRKTATSKAEKAMEEKTEGHRRRTKGDIIREKAAKEGIKVEEIKCSKKADSKKLKSIIEPKKEEDPLEALYKKYKVITVNFKGESIPLKSMEEDDFLAWIANLMPMTDKQRTGLFSQDFEDYGKKKRLLEKIIDYHMAPIMLAAKEQDKDPFTIH